MQKQVISQSVNSVSGFIGHLAANAEVKNNGTIVNFRLITNERGADGNMHPVGWDATIYGLKDKATGAILPVPEETVKILIQGALVTIYGSIANNPQDKPVLDAAGNPVIGQNGQPLTKHYENEYIRVSEVTIYDPYNVRFSGMVVGEPKVFVGQDGNKVLTFRLSHYNGKRDDGTYYPSIFQDVVKFRATDEEIALVKTGAFITATGRLEGSPSTKPVLDAAGTPVIGQDGQPVVKKYANKRINAAYVKECKLLEYTFDDNGMPVGEPRVVSRQPKPQAPAQPAAAQGAPAAPAQPAAGYQPEAFVETGENPEDMPF